MKTKHEIYNVAAYHENARQGEGRDVVSKHTPGPWKLSGANTVHGADCIVAFVGTADEEVRRFSGERQSADAHLIAAAPDLLEACEALLAGSSKAAPLARIAIAKAKGEMPWLSDVAEVADDGGA